MEFKTHGLPIQRLAKMKSKGATEVVKSRIKNKERQQLWDSMLEVYQKEVDKENMSDCEEVEINDIENWSMSHPGNDLRALPHLVQTNPDLVYKVLPGQLEDSSELRKEPSDKLKTKPAKKQVSAAGKSTSKDNKLISYVNVKTQKVGSNQSAKKAIKRKSNSSTDATLVKKKKTTKHALNQIETNVQTKKSKKVLTVEKNKKPIVKKSQSSKKLLGHKCKLRLSKYDKTKRISNREDGRIFKWNLVFRVCECSESDVVL